ncbi:segregation/condensation protein A [Pelagibacteraceae bacterium]|jgi:segregation and condensation protein A|nr:segregation/condensation protein A [Pelagibacteraceae bacterium]
MESKKLDQISIDIPNYNGPLEVLLDLAKTQKVDLAEISIALLADQFLDFIKNNENLNLETASEYLLMATWLAYLKSKLLLPDEDDDDFKALEVAEKLKLQLKKLELIRILSDQILKKKRLGVHIFSRGMKGGIKSINSPVYDISLYELLKSYSTLQMQSTFKTINIPKLPVFTTEEGIKQIKNNMNKITDWKSINDLIPKFYFNKKMKRTGLAGIFAASLELVKEGTISILQKKIFENVLIKKVIENETKR